MADLDPETATDYVRRHGWSPDPASTAVRSLGGGVSNHVLQVRWDDGCLVLKQPLPNLAVEDDWPADVERVHNEAEAARAYAAVIDDAGLDDVRVPGVAFEDRDDHVVGIECAPADAAMWKRELLAGRVDAAVARSVGRVLGAVHRRTADDDDLRASFASKRPFEQLRLDPYHRTTADRHPDVADAIRTEARRVASVDRTLVHGDYSPKNVLLARTGGGAGAGRGTADATGQDGGEADAEDGGQGNDGEGDGGATVAWILDFEVAHWGDPSFDVGFMLNHLFVKSVHNHDRAGAYVDAARAFFDAYTDAAPWDVERETVAELAVLMLARVDGKSPVEYVDEGPVADALRRIAKRVLTGDVTTLEGFAAVADEERAGL